MSKYSAYKSNTYIHYIFANSRTWHLQGPELLAARRLRPSAGPLLRPQSRLRVPAGAGGGRQELHVQVRLRFWRGLRGRRARLVLNVGSSQNWGIMFWGLLPVGALIFRELRNFYFEKLYFFLIIEFKK